MATAVEVSSVIDWIKERWPTTSGYRHWERVARDFALIPVEAMYAAARGHYDAGNRTAPSFAELKSESARIASERNMVDPTSIGCDVRGRHSRNWAIDYVRDRNGNIKTDGEGHPLREAQCLDCGTIKIKRADHLLTVGEVEAVRNATREAPGSPERAKAAELIDNLAGAKNIDDIDTERIAP